MAFIQRIQAPQDERCQGLRHSGEACTVIDCITTEPVTHEDGRVLHEAGAIVWHSHMDAAVDPLHRLNDSHPAQDHRGGSPVPVTVTPWCEDCKALAPQ